MKMSRTQLFYWTEPFAFSRARAREQPSQSRLRLFAFVALAFALMLGIGDVPENLSDVGLILLFSVPPALLIAYPGMWLVSRMPNSVLIEPDRIVAGQETIQLKQIESAIVGTTPMGGKVFPVLTFSTKSGRSYLFALSKKVDSNELLRFLKRAGIREPQV